jgi:3-oxoacyl-[acyl-carrier protein] reductase
MRTVLVTGASKGIGYAIARSFCESGENVIVNFNNTRDAAEELANSFAAHAMAVKADVSSFEQVKAMIEAAEAKFGTIDIVVNNAGLALWKLFTQVEEAEFDRVFAVNVKGMFNVCKVTVPQMIRRQFGRIINISSMWGLIGASCEVVYSASKAAVIGFSRGLAKELGPSNITVNCVAPGVIDTTMNAWMNEEIKESLKQKTPLDRVGCVQDIVGAVRFLASDAASFVTGQVICVDGGFSMGF